MYDSLVQVRESRAIMFSVGGFALFLLLTVLVHLRLIAAFDLAAATAIAGLASAPLDALGAGLSILFSAELSLLLALLIGLLLWRHRCGMWSLAPSAILALTVVELLMKIIVRQPVVPAEFHRTIYYPLASINLSGSFPSGHAARAGFLCTMLAVMISTRRGIGTRLVLGGIVLLAAMVGFTRVYLGDHWLSDVVAGLIFGVSLALLVAPPAARRLAAR